MRRLLLVLTALLVLPGPAALGLPAPAHASWTWPVRGDVITPYRNGSDPYAAGQHRGIDIRASVGTPVVAAEGGEVRFAGTAGSSGLTVSVRTGDGFDSSYLHLSSLAVRAGEHVSAGERLGAVGITGERSATEPHLHFGVREAGSRHAYRDPLSLLPPPPAPPATPPEAPRPAPEPAPAPAPPAPRPAPAPAPAPAPGRAPRPRHPRPAARHAPRPAARRPRPAARPTPRLAERAAAPLALRLLPAARHDWHPRRTPRCAPRPLPAARHGWHRRQTARPARRPPLAAPHDCRLRRAAPPAPRPLPTTRYKRHRRQASLPARSPPLGPRPAARTSAGRSRARASSSPPASSDSPTTAAGPPPAAAHGWRARSARCWAGAEERATGEAPHVGCTLGDQRVQRPGCRPSRPRLVTKVTICGRNVLSLGHGWLERGCLRRGWLSGPRRETVPGPRSARG